MKPFWIMGALCAVCGPVHAQDAAPQRSRLGVEVHADALDNGYADWRGIRVELGNEARGRTGGHVALLSEQRFGTTDTGIEFGASAPLGAGWSWVPTLVFAPGADFLPRAAADITLMRQFGQGWVVSGGVGHSDYRDTNVNRIKTGVERYVGAWRVSYQATASHMHGRTGVAHDLRFARAYADTGEIGVQLSAGREPTRVAGGMVNADVKGFGVFGHHALSRDWTLWWNAGTTRQGDFYTRRGAGLSLQYQY